MDTTGHKPWWSRPYHIVSAALTGLLALTFLATFIAMQLALSRRDLSFIEWINGPLIAIYILSGAAALWLMGVAPILAARDRGIGWHLTPRATRIGQWGRLIAIPALLAGTGVLVLAEAALDAMDHGAFDWPAASLAAALIGGGILVGVLTTPLRRWHRRLFMANVRDRKLCYHCGYDLRATTGDTCPECGKPTTLAAAHDVA